MLILNGDLGKNCDMTPLKRWEFGKCVCECVRVLELGEKCKRTKLSSLTVKG